MVSGTDDVIDEMSSRNVARYCFGGYRFLHLMQFYNITFSCENSVSTATNTMQYTMSHRICTLCVLHRGYKYGAKLLGYELAPYSDE